MDNNSFTPNPAPITPPQPTFSPSEPAQPVIPAPSFEQQFLSSVAENTPQIEIKTPRSTKSKVILTLSFLISVCLIATGVVVGLFSNTYSKDASSDELALRNVESKTLSETGFSAEYYEALNSTSKLTEARYAEEDSINSELENSFNLIHSGAIYFFIGAGISLILGITLFLKF